MVDRAFPGTQRPSLPQRSYSNSLQSQSPSQSQLPNRPNLPSRLSNVRSISQPVGRPVDVPKDGTNGEVRNRQAYAKNAIAGDGAIPQDVIDLEDGEEGPPMKKAKTIGREFHGKMPVTASMDMGMQQEMGMAYGKIPGEALPLPPRPSTTEPRARRSNDKIKPSARRSKDLEPPPIATKMPPPKNVADFSPWTGNHPEDMLNESVIKLGYFDKPPPTNQSESNTAKATLRNNLSQRNNFGLHTLSHLYVQVMEKRQALGRCTAPSTFKPPPRVTVTDTKREAWLRDLANPEMPLRRQSRTIPHGIRGKLLMEQCLSKNIPLQRAVWLAKCVGANELRAFRRKGISGAAVASGEQKWIREWTVQLEQFLEGVIAGCGQPEWNAKVNYAIRLATYFYIELLLDTEHYLDWIVSSFSEASLERVPAWTIVVQIYWKDIVSYGRRGKRLAEGVLAHLHEVRQKGSSAFVLLQQRLERFIAVLAVTSRGSLILPRIWDKYEALLSPELICGPGASNTADALRQIRVRNERLVRPLCQTPDKARSPLLELVTTLDAAGINTNIEKLAQDCMNIMPDAASLVESLLDWASTIYRQGSARIYLAARLIAFAKQSGVDTDSSVLRYLTTSDNTTLNISNVYELVAELVRRDSFSVGRYLQWLISSGVLASGEHDGANVGLLGALPAEHLTMSVANTRRTLLLRMGSSAEEQGEVEWSMQEFGAAVTGQKERLAELTTTLNEVRNAATKQAVCQSIMEHVDSDAKGNAPAFAPFCVARTALEQLEALPTLSTLLTKVITSNDPVLLSTASDTINKHAQALAMLGSLQPLLDGLCERYRVLRSSQPLDRTFILSLTELMSRMQGKAAMSKLLTDDLAICEQQTSQAACSPASDSLIGMQAGQDLEADEDIDRVFASGNVMDEQLMQRMFCSVIGKASKGGSATVALPEARSKVCTWLQQLRAVDAVTFHGLVKAYVANILNSLNDAGKVVDWAGIKALAASDCLALRAVLRSLDTKNSPRIANAALELAIGSSYEAGLTVPEEYRLKLQQHLYCVEHPDILARVISVACAGEDFDPTQSAVVELLVTYSISAPGMVLKAFQQLPPSAALRANSQKIVDALLRPQNRTFTPPSITSAEQVVEIATEMSLPYCIDAFRYLRASTERPQAISALKEALLDAISRGSSVWPQLLEGVEPHVQASLHDWAKQHLLDSFGKESPSDQENLARYTNVLDVTAAAASTQDPQSTLSSLAERLTALARNLPTTPTAQHSNSHLLRSIPTLLHLSTFHITTPCPPPSLVPLLTGLTTLLLHPSLQAHRETLTHLLDLTSAISEPLPDETLTAVRQQITPLLPAGDRRLLFLFGKSSQTSGAEGSAWLALASRGAAAGGNSQQHQQQQQQQQQQQRVPGRSVSGQQSLGAGFPAQQAALGRIPAGAQLQQQQQQQQQPPQGLLLNPLPPSRPLQSQAPADVKTAPYPLRRWELLSDPTPVMGENDGSLSLGLFGARRVG
ncbi:hypothetical protein MBLNU230_g6788t1 [Neophaeotheca triangularis]